MPLDSSIMTRIDLTTAVVRELLSRNRLLPTRWDYAALAADSDAVRNWLQPRVRRGPSGNRASIVFADKAWRGARPLHIMTLEDRVLYRALVGLIGESLPERLRSRVPIEQFRQAPLDVDGVRYVSKTDVAAYYEFIDHDLLCAELVAQTGEETAVDVLAGLLASILGRRVGLPQVHPASDILGDAYIDPVRRRLLRQGHNVSTYSDDFRFASPTLGSARASLEACAAEVRALGLVLNERKTYTYGAGNYRSSLTSFADAERRLFARDEISLPADGLGFPDSSYDDDDGEDTGGISQTLGAVPLNSSVEEDEAFAEDDSETPERVDQRRALAADAAWRLWEIEDESEETQGGQDTAITQSLLGRALPTMGAAGDRRPMEFLSLLLRFEPGLTPQIARYISAYAQHGQSARADLRAALDEAVAGKILSAWQGMWLAQAAGGLQRATRRHYYEDWLAECAEGDHDGLAATAAAALGRMGRGDADLVAATVERIGAEWRRLAFWGLIGIDGAKAEDIADDELDRLLLSAVAAQ